MTDDNTPEVDETVDPESEDADTQGIRLLIEMTSNDGTGPLYDYVAPTGSTFEYPDGSVPPVDEDGVPILEDRTDEFPDEAADATEVVGEPVQDAAEGAVEAPDAEETPTTTDAPSDGAEEAPADEGYDPNAHTVADVQAYLAENPDQADYVLDRERAGKARTTLIGA